jgi:DnaJ-class molecular chaperone
MVMICATCHGTGRRLNPEVTVEATLLGNTRISNPERLPLLVTCDECQGSGRTHCCEGLQEQPS